MKKIFLATAALVCSMSINAQVIKVYKDGSIIKTYTASESDSVVFAETVTHEYVDLGLPSGTLWATCNIGAEKPENTGLFFAWGETTGYTSNVSDGHSFVWANYKWCNGSSSTMLKYCTDSYYGAEDDKTVLEAADDAATVNWGSDWCMPSQAQIAELISKCTWTWDATNKGYKVTSQSDVTKHIFIPAAGYRDDVRFLGAGDSGLYWSNTIKKDDSWSAYFLEFGPTNNMSVDNDARRYGHLVRPVRMSGK